MFDKENADNIEKINAFMGMRHRSTPYDLTNPDDLRQAFLLTVAACMDYRGYWRSLENIAENLDESVEHYDTVTWINMGRSPEKADDLAMEAVEALSEASNVFDQMIERADRNCTVILKAVLSASPAVQKDVLGRTYSLPANELDKRIKELFDGLDEIDMHYQMDENRDAFLKLMEAMWENR